MRLWYVPLPDIRGSMKLRFLLATAFSGPVWAAVQFGEVIARKGLSATPLQITLLTMIMPLANLTAIWWSQIFVGRDQRPVMLTMGLMGSIAMTSGLWMNSYAHLFVAFLFYYLSYAVFNTGQNRLLQQHISTGTEGGVFGLANSLRMGIAALVSWLGGHWMDTVTDGYRHVFLVGGIFLFISTLVIASMPTRNEPALKRPWMNREIFLGPLIEAGRLLKRRPDFLRYEAGFMIYGMAFIGMLPVVPLFLVDDLQLDYTAIGLARGTVMQVVMIPSMALFGALFDKMTPHRMAVGAFGVLTLHPALLITAAYMPPEYHVPLVIASYVIFGLGMGGVSVLWSVSSVSFAGDEDAGVYQALHMAATAIRGTLAPLLAYTVMHFFGRIPAMALSAAFWLIAAIFMGFLDRKDGPKILQDRARLAQNGIA